MRATVSGELFAWALSKVAKFSEGSGQTAKLIEVVVANKGVLSVSAVGSYCGARVLIPAADNVAGKIVVTHDQVSRVSSVMPKEPDIKIEKTKSGNLSIAGSISNIGMKGAGKDNLVNFKLTDSKGWSPAVEDLKEFIQAVSWAGDASSETFTSGVLISPEKIECADGRKLARITPGPVKSGSALIPISVISKLGDLLYQDQDNIKLLVEDNKVWFYGPAVVPGAPVWACYFTLVNGTFPDTSRMTFDEKGIWNPHGDPSPVTVAREVPRKDFLDAARRVCAASSDPDKFMIDTVFHVVDGKLRIRSGNDGDVRVSEVVPLPVHEQLDGLRLGSIPLRNALMRMPGDTIDVLWGQSPMVGDGRKAILFLLRSKIMTNKGTQTYETMVMPRTD
jgi:hypothetical protein